MNFYFNHIITYLLIFKTVTYIFSEKPPKEYYSFTLDLATPEDLDFKCMLDYPKKKIYCFRSFSDEVDYIEQDILIQFPYPFPSLDDIEWDYDTFLSKVYRRVWNTKADCGNENIYNITDPNYKKWGLEGVLSRLSNNQCQVSSISKEDKHKFSFDMIVSFNSGEIVEKLNNKNNNDQIELLQEIWVPLLPPEEKKVKTKTYEREFPFAYCSTSDKINNKNYKNVKLNCYIPIELNTIFNGVIRINSFFDKLYIRQGKAVDIVTIYNIDRIIPNQNQNLDFDNIYQTKFHFCIKTQIKFYHIINYPFINDITICSFIKNTHSIFIIFFYLFNFIK